MKLAIVPVLGSLRKWVESVRALPLPRSLQRLTARGVARLAAYMPELQELLAQKPRAPRAAPTRSSAGLDELLGQLTSNDYRERLAAVQGLAHEDDARTVSALSAALRDRSVEVAVAAVSALVSVAGGGAAAELQDVLANEHGYYHALVRAAAVHRLGSLLGPAECQPITNALRDRDAEVSIAAIAALSASAPSMAAELLVDVVENREGFFLPVTRLAAARALERLPAPSPSSLQRLSGCEQEGELSQILRRVGDRTRGS